MTLLSSSSDLEKLAARIHQLIEPEGTKVEWDIKARDPDTGRPRQVDVRISRSNETIHVECRHHAVPQDVQWIEELMGRRISLGCDAVIAVSSSGFTKPARTKADAHGVVVRELSELTDAEIRMWGRRVSMRNSYIEILDLEVLALIRACDASKISQSPSVYAGDAGKTAVFPIVHAIVQAAGDKFVHDKIMRVSGNVGVEGLNVDGVSLLSLSAQLRGKLRHETISPVGVWIYNTPGGDREHTPTVTRYGLGDTEIIESENLASVVVDVSDLNPPRNCYLYTFGLDFGRVVKAQIHPIGAPRMMTPSFDMILDVKAVA